MTKGKLADMMSKARFTEGTFYVQYRDFKELVQLPVAEFWKIASIVPEHRIARIIERTYEPVTAPDVTGTERPLSSASILPTNTILYESSNEVLLALPVVIMDEVDPETLRFVEMRDALDQKTKWRRYEELERISHLKEEGRELLGEIAYIQEKQDGSNVSLWLEPNGDEPHVSSHNMVNADPKIVSAFQSTKEYERAVQFLKDEREQYGHEYILYGELRKAGKSPTRVERHKRACWSLFDIWDMKNGEWLPYPLIYQYAFHWKIPMVKLLETYTPYHMEDIPTKILEWKKWARRHRREGVVIKVYKKGELIGAKEKIDLPDLPAETRENIQKSTYPPMPEETRAYVLYSIVMGRSDKSNRIQVMKVCLQYGN